MVMNDEINYENNPLHGVSLKNLLTEMVDYYGFDILFAYLNINCFDKNPSIDSSVKFLKKTDWAREKVEAFYMYEFKNLPRASEEQFELPPRDRIVPEGQLPGEPAELSLEDAERLHEKRARKRAERDAGGAHPSGPGRDFESEQGRDYARDREHARAGRKPVRSSDSGANAVEGGADPWAKWKK
jgi:uncharacterized protein (DUF2132 family)